MRNERYGTPLVLYGGSEDSAKVLVEVPLDDPSFREDRLQELIAKYPKVLPVEELEPAFAPLICLGREIPCKSGAIDILFSSPTGQLSLVETKLWGNPESRREVVGQIIEYAKDMSHWSFRDLDHAVQRAGIPVAVKGDGIMEIIKRSATDLAEISYHDTVVRNLQRANCLLIIAGNGIRENVSEIAEYLQSTPNLHFSLVLVELALFRFDLKEAWPVLVQPRIVGRTLQLVRAVVEVRAPQDFEVSVTLPEKESDGTRITLTEEVFIDQVKKAIDPTTVEAVRQLLAELVDLGLIKKWGATGVSLRFPDPRGMKDFTVLFINNAGRFYLGWLSELAKCGYDSEIATRYRDGVIKLTGAKPSGVDGTKETPVQALIHHKDDFLGLVTRFLEALRAAASDKGSS
jgi:hypothetical protein